LIQLQLTPTVIEKFGLDDILADQNFVAIPTDQIHWQPGKNLALASLTSIFEKSALTCGGVELTCGRVERVIVVFVVHSENPSGVWAFEKHHTMSRPISSEGLIEFEVWGKGFSGGVADDSSPFLLS